MEKPTASTERQIEEAVRILKVGGIVAFPTDTVYGLGAAIDTPRAVERVYAVKRRPADMALPLLAADAAGITGLAEALPPAAERLIEAFLPGALTIVLSAAATVPRIVTAADSTVAVRIPAHPVPIALVRGIGGPITGTSANLSGLPSPLTAAEATEAEGAEERGSAKGNQLQQTRFRAQNRRDLQRSLERVRQAAEKDKRLRFTSIWHQVYDIKRLREAYLRPRSSFRTARPIPRLKLASISTAWCF